MTENLEDDIAKLETKQLQFLGKDMTGLGLKELQQIEQQLNEGLLSVKERKEQRAMLENETLRRQVEELRCLFPLTEHMVPSIQYDHLGRKDAFVNNGVTCPNLATVYGNEKGDSDTTLLLGLPTDVHQKRKAPERVTLSNDSESQMALL